MSRTKQVHWPVNESSYVVSPIVQQLLTDLVAARDNVVALEKELTDICLRSSSATQSVDQQPDADDSDPDAGTAASVRRLRPILPLLTQVLRLMN